VFERGVNAFVQGLVSTLPDLWYWELAGSATIRLLQEIRALNETIPEADCVRIHLVDLDFGNELIHRHLLAIHEELGQASDNVRMPDLGEFETLNEEEILSIIDQMEGLTGGEGCVSEELHGLRNSVHFRFVRGAVERWEEAADQCTAIRDGGIAQTVECLLKRPSVGSLLALFGGAHVQKRPIATGVRVGFKTVVIQEPYWVQQLVDAGIAICSLLTCGLSGFVASHGQAAGVAVNAEQLRFPDGTTLAEVLQGQSEFSLVYIDLRNADAGSATFGADFCPMAVRFDPELRAGEAFDGIVLFRHMTPAW
jgi:hypothetical protein